jgi:hypothetical protein
MKPLSPTNKTLYEKVKKEASRKFKSPTGVYRSSWIVREYKKRGGRYKGSRPKSSGLKRWYKEKWVDLKRPIKTSSGKINLELSVMTRFLKDQGVLQPSSIN